MILLETAVVAFGMFSALPMPRIDWNEKNMRYALCAFPLVGLAVGGASWAAAALCGALGLPALLQGAILCLLPVAITGGIHLDGFADTCDALASHAPTEKKQEILKDPRLGCFAAIRLCCWFVACWALWASLPRFSGPAVLLGYCFSRALSGLATVTLPMAKDTGLAHMFAEAADKRRAKRFLQVLCLALLAGLTLCGTEGMAMALAALAVLWYYKKMSKKQFGGISGDLQGWFLQMAELAMLAALFCAQWLEAMA